MFTESELKILRANKVIPEGANAEQAAYFFEVCKRKKLDPFLKQVHMIERNERDGDNGWKKSYTIQASLDGMRAIAQRNVKILEYRRTVKKIDGETYGCCEIRTEDRGAYYDEVPLSEYIQKTKSGEVTKFWKQFPTTMIKKVAEESVLRMVSPEDLSGLYGDEEMQQADKEDPKQIAARAEQKKSDPVLPAHGNHIEEAQVVSEEQKHPYFDETISEISGAVNMDNLKDAFMAAKQLIWTPAELAELVAAKDKRKEEIAMQDARAAAEKESPAFVPDEQAMDALFGAEPVTEKKKGRK